MPLTFDHTLKFDQASLDFGPVKVVQELTLAINVGERVAIVGSSGAGKTTLLSLANGLLSPTEGTVKTLGANLQDLRHREQRQIRHRVGTIRQQFDLVGPLSVLKNLVGGHLGRWSTATAIKMLVQPSRSMVDEATQALEQVGMKDYLTTRVDKLSGGQQQRVALARVLIQNPDLILADEPVASLDPPRAAAILDLLGGMCEPSTAHPQPRTLVVALHQWDLISGRFDRVIGLKDGRVVVDGPAATVDPSTLAELAPVAS